MAKLVVLVAVVGGFMRLGTSLALHLLRRAVFLSAASGTFLSNGPGLIDFYLGYG